MTDAPDTPELLPCPMCGGPAELWNAHPENPKLPAWVACMGKCVVLVSNHFETNAEAVAAWNRRAPSAAYAAGAAEMRRRARDAAMRRHLELGGTRGIAGVDDEATADAISALPLPVFNREEMVERVAKEMFVAQWCGDADPEWVWEHKADQHEYRDMARAALSVLMGER